MDDDDDDDDGDDDDYDDDDDIHDRDTIDDEHHPVHDFQSLPYNIHILAFLYYLLHLNDEHDHGKNDKNRGNKVQELTVKNDVVNEKPI